MSVDRGAAGSTAAPSNGHADSASAGASEIASGEDRLRAANDDERIPASADAGAGDASAEGEQRGDAGRRRGRGRGRDRGPREGAPSGDSGNAFAQGEAAASEGVDSGAARIDREAHPPAAFAATPPFGRDEHASPEADPMAQPWHAADATTANDAAAARTELPRRAETVARTEQPAPAEPAARAEPAPIARAEPYALPIDSLAAVAESAGLQWVNSDADKIEAAQAVMAAMPAAPRVPREIAAPPAVDEGPLVMVETKKDLAQVKLPFETTAQETQGH